MDETKYASSGRSYGMHGSIGLYNSPVWPAVTASYTFEDVGYNTSVHCSYNLSSAVHVDYDSSTSGRNTYVAWGLLPNSPPDEPEQMAYGSIADTRNIVVFTFAGNPVDDGRIIAISAGATYKQLDLMQCAAQFVPTAFDVSVSIASRIIAVTPPSQHHSVADIFPSGNISRIVMRGLATIPVDLSAYLFSFVGEAFNTSITSYRMSHQQYSQTLGISGESNDTNSALRAVEIAFTAMIDDILTAYGAAQFMVAGDTRQVTTELEINAIRFGQASCIYAVFAINIAILLLVIAQGVRTRLWYDLPAFDCLDPSSMLLASSRGGKAISTAVDALDRNRVTVSLDRSASDRLVLDATRH